MRKKILISMIIFTVIFGMVGRATASSVFVVNPLFDTIVEFDFSTGAITNQIPTPEPAAWGCTGLAHLGNRLYFVTCTSNVIYELDQNTGDVLNSFPAPSYLNGTNALGSVGGFLYSLDYGGSTIFKIDPATFNVISYCFLTYASGGLAGGNGRLFSALFDTEIVEVDPDTCANIGGPFPNAGNGEPVLGLAFDGNSLFTTSAMYDVYELDPDTGELRNTFNVGFQPTALAGASNDVSVPDIKANGSDGPVIIPQGSNLAVTIALDPGSHSGENADWWILIFYYNPGTGSWVPIVVNNFLQAPLFDLSPFTILNTSGLPGGAFIFFYGVDMNMNGLFDNPLFSDLVVVVIQ